MTKRVIDSATGLSLTMKIEDRGRDATLILEYQGRRIETKVAGSDHPGALAAYRQRDLETFGGLFDPPPPALHLCCEAHDKIRSVAA